ncbi:MAG: hypothetical protein QG633_38 [Patescibacteria group bacterium]|jgi:hypothetical protein|nr:hypothetical protein [Patescibacteria group bacterium]
MSRIPFVSWSWKEGRVWDHWMIVHFASGIAIACVLELLSLDTAHAYLIALGLLVAWEIGEKIGRVEEETENLVLDVVFGMFGFALFEQVIFPLVSREGVVWILITTLIFAIGGSVLGWMAYKRRSE